MPKKKDTALTTKVDYSDHEGQGFENQTAADQLIPFLSVLQKMSPQVDENPKAKPGLLYNTVSQEVYGKEVLFVPAITDHCYVEWKPRDDGGGMVGKHSLHSEIVSDAKKEHEFGKLKTPEGNDLVETFYIYGVVVDGDPKEGNVLSVAIVAFTSTKISIYKKINTRLSTFQITNNATGRKQRPPLFAHLLRIGTQQQENVHGKFFNFDIKTFGEEMMEGLLNPNDPRFAAAAAVREAVESGNVREDYSKSGDDTEGNF